MPTADVIAATSDPLTRDALADRLRACGLRAGMTVLAHTSLSRLGWVVGGPVTVIDALLDVLGPGGTLMMPTHTADNTEPANWSNPPVPPAWVPTIRASMPAYDPRRSPTRAMGVVAELFRTWPGVVRSAHPVGSFAACGPDAARLTAEHDELGTMFGERSPLAALYALDGHVLLLGVGHENNTSLHLAEMRARWPGKRTVREGAALCVGGERRWVAFDMDVLDSDDFGELGAHLDAALDIAAVPVGLGRARVMRVRPLVDAAVPWLEQRRGAAR